MRPTKPLIPAKRSFYVFAKDYFWTKRGPLRRPLVLKAQENLVSIEPPRKRVKLQLNPELDTNNRRLEDEDIDMDIIVPVVPNVGVFSLLAGLVGSQTTVAQIVPAGIDVLKLEQSALAPEIENNNREVVRVDAPIQDFLTDERWEPGQESDVRQNPEPATESVGTRIGGQVVAEGRTKSADEPQQYEQKADSEHIHDSLSRSDAVSRELNIEASGSGATDEGDTFPDNEPQELRGSSEPGDAVTLDHISNVSLVVNDKVLAIKGEFEKKNLQLVEKWLKTTSETRKQTLDESRKKLCILCETELNKLHPGFTAPALVEFGKVYRQTNVRCEVSEDDQVKHLLQVLGKTSEDLCAHFPALCNAHKTHQPLTVHNIREAELLSFERYERLSQHAVQQESKKASDGIQAAIKREEGVMDGIIALRKKNHQDARASAERERKKNDARFIESTSFQDRKPRRKSGASDRKEREREKQAPNKEREMSDQFMQSIPEQEVARFPHGGDTIPRHLGLPTQQHQSGETTNRKLTLKETLLQAQKRKREQQQLEQQQPEQQRLEQQQPEQQQPEQQQPEQQRPEQQQPEQQQLEQQQRLEQQQLEQQQQQREQQQLEQRQREQQQLEQQQREQQQQQPEEATSQEQELQHYLVSLEKKQKEALRAYELAQWEQQRREQGAVDLELQRQQQADYLSRQEEASNEECERGALQWRQSKEKLASALEILTNVSATQNDSRQKELRRAIGKGDIDIDRESSGWQEPPPPVHMDIDLDSEPSGLPEPHFPGHMSTDFDSEPTGLLGPPCPPGGVTDSSNDRAPPGRPETSHPPGGTTDCSPSSLSCAGLCQEHFSTISKALDRTTKVVEMVANQVMRLQRNTPTTSTRGEDLDESTPTPRPKFRVPAKKTTHKDPKELLCRERVRKHMNEMMGRRHRTNTPLKPAPEQAVLKYNKTLDDEDGPSKDKFQVDLLTTPCAKSAWNLRLFEIFVGDYAKGRPDDNVKDLSTYFMTYLQTLQINHRKMTTINEGRTVYEVSSQRSRIEKRKKTRFDSQINALHYHGLRRFIKPLTQMSHAVLSDDESDHESGTNLGQGRYAIVGEAWRSNELIIWLRLIDLLACGEKWDGRNVARQGNSRRLRVHSSRLKDGVAVAGLPANCYDSYWLNSLKPHERELLNVQAPLDMQFSDEERRRAAKYIPLTNGETRLRSENADISGLDEWLLDLFGKLQNQSSA